MNTRRRSLQRQWVLEAILDGGHLSAGDIFQKVKNVHPEISLATVYRNIGILLEEEKISIINGFVQNPDLREYYDGRMDTHGHFICSQCKKIYDLEMPNELGSDDGHLIQSTKLLCYGICNSCRTM